MFLNDSLLIVEKESIRKYGATGAIILQVLYSEYGYDIPLLTEEWCKPEGILNFIQIEIVKRTLNAMDKAGLISIQDTKIVLENVTKEYKKEGIFKEEIKEKKDRKENPAWDMAVVLMEVYGENKELFTPKKNLTFANKLLKMNVTKEDIQRLYIGDNSWWYTSTYSGQHGNKPNQIQIGKTINDALKGVPQGSLKPDSKGAFWS